MSELIGLYREAWKSAGHKGKGSVMLAFHMFCWPDEREAIDLSKSRINSYLKTLVNAGSDCLNQASSDYPGYRKLIEDLAEESFESQLKKGAAWVGTPSQICDQIKSYKDQIGDFEIASLQVNFYDMPLQLARKSISLFAEEVMPKF